MNAQNMTTTDSNNTVVSIVYAVIGISAAVGLFIALAFIL